jgi:hypothetical protein
MDDHSHIASVSVTPHGDSVELGKPQSLFPAQPSNFEATADGKRLLLMQAPVQSSASLTLIVNWLQELKK